MGAGVNTIDVDTATRLGIAVANMPGANAAVGRRGHRAADAGRAAPAARAGPGHPRGQGLAVGPEPRRDGARHRRLHRRAGRLRQHRQDASRRIVAAMGAEVLHTSTRDDGHPGWRPLPELLAASDIVSLHLPLTEPDRRHARPRRAGTDEARRGAGQHLARRRSSTRTRSSTRCAPGGLAAAGLDVFAVEPIPADNPLLEPGQRGAHPARHLVHRRHHAALPGPSRSTTAAGMRDGP